MSEFFKSEIIQTEMKVINDLQRCIYDNTSNFISLSREDKIEHIDDLTVLLEKQRVMYTRLSLSDDPDAKKMKLELCKSVTALGFPMGTDMSMLFSAMEKSIEALKQNLDN
mgnify:FL=1|tara:strand:- start:190 stop:522 length:333 start_codon:yes stop_codon:yes gene_type:complete